MSVRLEIRLAVLSLLGIQVVMAFGAIGLLGRDGGGAVALAGAWSMVVLTLIGLCASALVMRRLTSRIVAPLARLDEALAGHERGDHLRRPNLSEAPAELRRIAAAVAALMDPRGDGAVDPRAAAAADRAALLHLLDGMAAPALVVDGQGVPTAAGAAALLRLEADPQGVLRRALAEAAAGRPAAGVRSATPLASGTLFLCTLAGPGGDGEAGAADGAPRDG